MRRRSIILSLLLISAVLVGLILMRGAGISAKREPTKLEAALAKRAWRFLVPREYAGQASPVSATAEALRMGMEHWADHCATCHGNDGSGDTQFGRNLHPRAPDIRTLSTQRLTDGELFYAIEEGIPFTGMPAWRNGTEEGTRASWELVQFIRHLPRLTAVEKKEMEALNPRSPAEHRRLRDIDDFLKGKGK